jgi:hypothetical protein
VDVLSENLAVRPHPLLGRTMPLSIIHAMRFGSSSFSSRALTNPAAGVLFRETCPTTPSLAFQKGACACRICSIAQFRNCRCEAEADRQFQVFVIAKRRKCRSFRADALASDRCGAFYKAIQDANILHAARLGTRATTTSASRTAAIRRRRGSEWRL